MIPHHSPLPPTHSFQHPIPSVLSGPCSPTPTTVTVPGCPGVRGWGLQSHPLLTPGGLHRKLGLARDSSSGKWVPFPYLPHPWVFPTSLGAGSRRGDSPATVIADGVWSPTHLARAQQEHLGKQQISLTHSCSHRHREGGGMEREVALSIQRKEKGAKGRQRRKRFLPDVGTLFLSLGCSSCSVAWMPLRAGGEVGVLQPLQSSLCFCTSLFKILAPSMSLCAYICTRL